MANTELDASIGGIPSPRNEQVRITHLPVRPVAKVAFLVGSLLAVALLAALAALYAIGQRTGLVGNLERFVAESLGAESFHIIGLPLLGLLAFLGALTIAFATLAAVAITFAFNWIATSAGGIQVTVTPTEPATATRPAATARRTARTTSVPPVPPLSPVHASVAGS